VSASPAPITTKRSSIALTSGKVSPSFVYIPGCWFQRGSASSSSQSNHSQSCSPSSANEREKPRCQRFAELGSSAVVTSGASSASVASRIESQ